MLRARLHAASIKPDLGTDPIVAQQLVLPGYKAKPERAFLLHLEAFDWNCQQHITPRFTETELEAAFTQVGMWLGQLEAENKRLEAENRSLAREVHRLENDHAVPRHVRRKSQQRPSGSRFRFSMTPIPSLSFSEGHAWDLSEISRS